MKTILIAMMLMAAAVAQDATGSLTLRQVYGSAAPSGAVLHFHVDAASGAFEKIYLVGEGVDGTPSATAPYDLSIWVPRNVTGLRRFRAVGVSGSGQLQFSEPVQLTLSPVEQPDAIATPVSNLRLAFVGDSAQVRVTGRYSDGGKAELTHAPATSYRSSDLKVVQVNASGVAIATGAGNAEIQVQFGGETRLVHVAVPAVVAGDLNGDGKVDQDDANVLLDAIGAPQALASDARDLNRDGKIDAADLALLKRLCGNAGCVRE